MGLGLGGGDGEIQDITEYKLCDCTIQKNDSKKALLL